ncbi:MAG TPA: hypothetical protein VHK86_01595 [Nitrososphaera sp.]|nr:hypothetical protein [Nitrososphaera sp.]
MGDVVEKKKRGRPVGSLSARTKALRDIADDAIMQGITPIEVMLDNMRFYHEQANVLQAAVITKVSSKGKLKDEDAMKLLTAFQDMGANRMKAQACASEAAPYVHPRLTASQADVNVKVSVEEAEQAFKLVAGAMNAADSGEIFVPAKKSKVAA